MTFLGFLNCMINTLAVIGMGIGIMATKQYAYLPLFLIVASALVGQWYFSLRKRK